MEFEIFPIEAAHETKLVDCVQATFPAPHGEVMARTLDLHAERYLAYTELVCAKAIRDGLSFGARLAGGDGTILGFCINEDLTTAPHYRTFAIHEAMHPLLALLDDLDALAHPREAKVGEVFHFYMLGVRREYQRYGLGRTLISRGLLEGRARGFHRAWAEATGVGSQTLVAGLGFQTLAEIPYREFLFRGQAIFASIEAPRGCRLVEKDLGLLDERARQEEHGSR